MTQTNHHNHDSGSSGNLGSSLSKTLAENTTRDRARPLTLSGSRITIILALLRRDGQSVAELARITKLNPNKIGIFIAKLEERGWLTRETVVEQQDFAKVKKKRIYLTGSGYSEALDALVTHQFKKSLYGVKDSLQHAELNTTTSAICTLEPMNREPLSPLSSAPLSVYWCEDALAAVLFTELELPCAEKGWRCSLSLRHFSGFYSVPSTLGAEQLIEHFTEIANDTSWYENGQAECLNALKAGHALVEIELNDGRSLSYRWVADGSKLLEQDELKRAVSDLYGSNKAAKTHPSSGQWVQASLLPLFWTALGGLIVFAPTTTLKLILGVGLLVSLWINLNNKAASTPLANAEQLVERRKTTRRIQ